MAIINLETEGIVNLTINGIDFKVDTTDIECIQALDSFSQKYISNVDMQLSKELITECSILIDKILGANAYTTLFKKSTLKVYLLCFELINVFQNAIVDMYAKSLQNKEEHVDEMNNNINKVMEQAKKVEEIKNNYGIQSRQSQRPSSKN